MVLSLTYTYQSHMMSQNQINSTHMHLAITLRLIKF